MKELGWTPQIPITRAVQRDEEAIERWRVEVWPELRRKAVRERRTLVFIDESGFYLLPGKVKTYGPKGKTPVLDKWLTRDHLSVMAGFTPAGKVYTLVRPESLSSSHSVVFLEHLLRQTGNKIVGHLGRLADSSMESCARMAGQRWSKAGSFGDCCPAMLLT